MYETQPGRNRNDLPQAMSVTRDRTRVRRWTAVLGVGVVAAASMAIGAGNAAAASTSDTFSTTVDNNGPGTGSVAQFNPALGTLTSVDWSVSTDALAQVCIENLSQESPTSTGGTAGSALTVTFPGATTTTSTATVPVPSTLVPPSNGVDDCLNGYDFTAAKFTSPVSAPDVLYGSTTAPQMATGNITDSGQMATFTGNGSVNFGYNLSSNASILNPSEWDITFIAEGSVRVTVTYNYAPLETTTTSTTTTAPSTTTTTPGATTTSIADEAPPSTVVQPTTTTVVPSVPTTTGGALPKTGGSPNGTVILGLFALAGGCALFAVSRRRINPS